MRPVLIASAMALALAAGGCKVSTAPENGTEATAQQGDWPGFVNSFIEASFKANPGFAVVQGRHEYDGQIADLSDAGIQAEVDRLKKAVADAEGFTDDKLTPQQRYERDYLISVAKGQLFWIDPTGADQLHNNPAAYLGFVDPSVYITVPYAPKEQRLKSYIKFLQNVPRAMEQMRANIQTPMATSFVDYAKSAFGGFAQYYPGDGMAAWKGVGTPEDQQALKAATDNAVKAMQDTVTWVESQRAGSKPNFALGKEKFQRMLADTEMVTTPVEQFEQIGRADLAANQKLLGEACARYAAGPDDPGMHGQDERQQAEGRRGCRRPGPARQPEAVHPAARHRHHPRPRRSQGRGSAALQPAELRLHQHPRPLREETAVRLLHRAARPELAEGEQDAFVPGEADLLFTSVHEVWPGHFLNFLHANRSKDMFGRVFVGYAFAEGWAHYTEEMMRVKGVGGGTDEILIGQLSNALLRDCRFLSAIGMHTGSMTQQQSYDLFRNQCYQD